MKKLFILLALSATTLLACESEPMRFSNPERLGKKVQYFKDHKGNCFAVIGIRKTATTYMNGIGLTLVPPHNCK